MGKKKIRRRPQNRISIMHNFLRPFFITFCVVIVAGISGAAAYLWIMEPAQPEVNSHFQLTSERESVERGTAERGIVVRENSAEEEELIEEIKDGLDELCEQVSVFLEDCAGKELDLKPIYVSGEGLDGIRGALEHMSRRLSAVCEQLSSDLPYYNKPSMSSRIALIDMACEDNRTGGIMKKSSNFFGG